MKGERTRRNGWPVVVSTTQNFSFDPGLGLAPDTTLSVRLGAVSAAQFVDSFAVGYAVPSSEVSSSTS